MKVQLVKEDIKKTFGSGDISFDYYIRPLTFEEKTNVNNHIVWKKVGRQATVDFAKTDITELLRLAISKLGRLVDSDEMQIDTIDKFLDMKTYDTAIDGAATVMWVEAYLQTYVPESLKKKSLPDSGQEETK